MNVKEVGVEGPCEYSTELAVSVGDVVAVTVCQQ